MLTLSSGKSGSCSCPETKTELAEEKINLEFMGIVERFPATSEYRIPGSLTKKGIDL